MTNGKCCSNRRRKTRRPSWWITRKPCTTSKTHDYRRVIPWFVTRPHSSLSSPTAHALSVFPRAPPSKSALTSKVTGSPRKKFGLIPTDSAQGNLSQIIPVHFGQHDIRLRIEPDD